MTNLVPLHEMFHWGQSGRFSLVREIRTQIYFEDNLISRNDSLTLAVRFHLGGGRHFVCFEERNHRYALNLLFRELIHTVLDTEVNLGKG